MHILSQINNFITSIDLEYGLPLTSANRKVTNASVAASQRDPFPVV